MPKPLRIFIVDDDPDSVAAMTVALEARGHSVRSNLIGDQAIPQIVDMHPDVVLIDLMMPTLDGYALTREIRMRPELTQTRFIMVSARHGAMWREKSEETGLHGYITKPIDLRTFADLVEAAAK